MRIMPKVCRAILARMLLLTSISATASPEAPAATVWGPTSDGLQCGLTMLPQNGGAYEIALTLKNVGLNSITFTVGEIKKAAYGLLTADQAGNTKRLWSSFSGADPAELISLRRANLSPQGSSHRQPQGNPSRSMARSRSWARAQVFNCTAVHLFSIHRKI
jgi:hypothetical protein